ncbi:ATP-binding protein [Alkalinema sp. FACHB-956]|uniref:ATP-binding protein n=1 Tax=Alkalinema sp. FACHB-956 TaxID=2692768 RepID=UPI0016846BAB|nr:ATP-binding protein [Alkalinema sp. FACHB-956]MBD2329180.1 histidine kinase [Alkalinema sp. FACHB-956]
MTSSITLPPHIFAEAFPFHFILDSELNIVQAGSVLQRVCLNSLVGNSLEQFFEITRPKITLTFEAIKKQRKSLFLLNSIHSEMQLKGQMIYLEEGNLLCFLGSPWITDTSGLEPLGLKLKDFAIHDPIVDFIFLLQAKNTSLNDAKRLTEELQQQQLQLKNALRIKENLAKIAESQAKRLEETLRDLQDTQAQLIQTEKMSGLGQMVAGIAHEVNNPVNFIHGNLSYVLTYSNQLLDLIALYQKVYSKEHPEIAELIEAIDLDFLIEDFPQTIRSMQMGTERIREIVNSLRTFSRLDEAERKAVNLHDGLESTLLILKHRLKPHGQRPAIEIIKDYGALPLVECFSGQLNQVFMNIIANAIDALEEHYFQVLNTTGIKVPLRIYVSTVVNTDNKIIIRLADNGSGIPESVRGKIFDPFFTTKPIGKGTGLGLSICYKIIVDTHGGSLTCKSAPNQGTEFTIELFTTLPIQNTDQKLIELTEIVGESSVKESSIERCLPIQPSETLSDKLIRTLNEVASNEPWKYNSTA